MAGSTGCTDGNREAEGERWREAAMIVSNEMDLAISLNKPLPSVWSIPGSGLRVGSIRVLCEGGDSGEGAGTAGGEVEEAESTGLDGGLRVKAQDCFVQLCRLATVQGYPGKAVSST